MQLTTREGTQDREILITRSFKLKLRTVKYTLEVLLYTFCFSAN